MRKKSMVNVAYELLLKKQNPQSFNNFWKEVSEIMGLEKSQADDMISEFYTHLSMDERFVLLEDNHWDLRDKHKFDKVHIDMNDAYSEIEEEEKEIELEAEEENYDDDYLDEDEDDEDDDEDDDLEDDEEEDEDY